MSFKSNAAARRSRAASRGHYLGVVKTLKRMKLRRLSGVIFRSVFVTTSGEYHVHVMWLQLACVVSFLIGVVQNGGAKSGRRGTSHGFMFSGQKANELLRVVGRDSRR